MKANRKLELATMAAVAALLLATVGCGSDDDGGGATPAATATPTRALPTATANPSNTAVPTATPTVGSEAAVRGFLVVDDGVQAGAGDTLLAAPEIDFIGPGFERSLSFADWSLECAGLAEERQGTTDEAGRFVIAGVPAGDCTLQVDKTVGGNLMSFSVPFSVGDDGTADVVAEVSWGRVRVTSTYTAGGADVRKVSTNHGSLLLYRDGRLSELADYTRHLIDDDGDGFFESPSCDGGIWQCEDFGACGDGRRCACTASCPFCEDCGPPVCAPPFPSNPYQCDDDGGCANPDDECVCVSSSADTQDCPRRVCVPPCLPVEIETVDVYGLENLVVGQDASYGATARLSDGSAVDVTGLADWASDSPALEIGAWGVARGVAVGTANVTAALGDAASEPLTVVVTERPALRAIHLNNYQCYPVPLGGPIDPLGPLPEPALVDEAFAPPLCADAIEIGGQVQLRAMGEFANGYWSDITDEVAWSAAPESVVSVELGTVTGVGEGTATISASLDGITSNAQEIRVVSERSVVDINIYPETQVYFAFAIAEPCFEFVCPGAFTVLIGDEIQFRATARFDIGGWEDVTEQVTWVAEDGSVITFAEAGAMTAIGAGQSSVHATLGDVTSHPYDVRVVAEATLQQLDVYQEGNNAGDRVIEKGGQAFFHAQGYYDVGFGRDATEEATWRSSDEAVARFDEAGVLTGLAAGDVMVWAELDGVESQPQTIEVFEQSDIEFCDVENVNRGTWTDGFNRVYLESDCDEYAQPDVVQIRFTVTERERPGGIFDPCLDLYAYRVDGEEETFVRTIREEGCGEPFLAAGAPELDDQQLRYQLRAFWDLKDDAGSAVAAGTYRIKGRFYLYYDPVVTIDVTVD